MFLLEPATFGQFQQAIFEFWPNDRFARNVAEFFDPTRKKKGSGIRRSLVP